MQAAGRGRARRHIYPAGDERIVGGGQTFPGVIGSPPRQRRAAAIPAPMDRPTSRRGRQLRLCGVVAYFRRPANGARASTPVKLPYSRAGSHVTRVCVRRVLFAPVLGGGLRTV